jgi:HNH endonuclease
MSGRVNPEKREALWKALSQGIIKTDPATGEVFSYAKGRTIPRRLQGYTDRFGHLYTTIHVDGRQWGMVPIHHVVWMAANGHIPGGYEIDHVNRNPADNRLVNLRLATPSQNGRNSDHRIGEGNNHAKLTWEQVREIRELRAAGMKPKAIAEAYGTTPAYVGRIVRHDVWR